jgi:hypothetical protein
MLLDTVFDTHRSSINEAVPDLPGLADFAGQVDAAAAVIAARLGCEYFSLLLTGAAARGEQTIDPAGRLASDLDFLVVLHQRHPASAVLAERRCRSLLSGCEAEMPFQLQGAISIGFASSSPNFWRLATPAMYELRMNARCLHGSAAVLNWPLIDDPERLPAWEGVRLVANRLCEMFGALSHHHDFGNITSVPDSALTVRYTAVKQALACSEAALIVSGGYRPTYRERFVAHTGVAHMFSRTQNAFINDAYSAKLGAPSPIFDLDPDLLVRNASALALHTLAMVEVSTPAGIASLLEKTPSTAPGLATDMLYFAHQALKGNRVPVRRAIASVYGDALTLAERLVAPQPQHLPLRVMQYQHVLDTGAGLYRRYKGTPQAVGTI